MVWLQGRSASSPSARTSSSRRISASLAAGRAASSTASCSRCSSSPPRHSSVLSLKYKRTRDLFTIYNSTYCRPGIQHRHVLRDRGHPGQEGGGGGRQYPEPRLHSQVSQPQRKQGERYVDQQCCQVAH